MIVDLYQIEKIEEGSPLGVKYLVFYYENLV